MMSPTDALAAEAWLRLFDNEGTRRSFDHALGLWRDYLGDRSVMEATREDVEAWRDRLRETTSARTGRLLTAKTIDSRLVALRSFYDYLCQEGVLQANPARHVKLTNPRPERRTVALSGEEMVRLAAAADGLDPARRLFVAVHVSTACRVGEALDLRVSDVAEESGHPVVWLTRAGGDRDCVVLPANVYEAIREHVAALGLDGNDPLFSRPGWPPMTYSSTRFVYEWLGRKAGLVRVVGKMKRYPDRDKVESIVTPHMLRVAGLALLLDKGQPVERVQRLAGHRRAESTLRYRPGPGDVQDLAELAALLGRSA